MPRTSYELTHCPVCDSLDNIELADANAMVSEVERLRAFHARRLRVGVPPEYLTDRVAFSQDPPLRLSQCRVCSHVYRNPWERREALASAYGESAASEAVLQTLFATQSKAYRGQVQRLTSVTGRPGRGLEVGSYVGGFLAAAREGGWTFEGVDVNESAKEFATRSGFKVTRGEIGDVVTDQPFDVVAIWNTFEQLYDTRSALIAAGRLLRQGGMLAIRIPNGGFYVSWRRRLRAPLSGIAACLLAHNNLLSFPYRQGFTRRSLVMLLRECHFEVVRVFGDTLVPIADQWTTTYGALEERVVKSLQRFTQLGWNAPWVEVYARLV